MPFLPGLELCRRFYEEAVRPLLERYFPDLPYAAARIGPGSDVVGFDTEMSRDYDWGPQLQFFLREQDAPLVPELDELFRTQLPHEFAGFQVNFNAILKSPLNIITQIPPVDTYQNPTISTWFSAFLTVVDLALASLIVIGGYNVIVGRELGLPHTGLAEFLPRLVLAFGVAHFSLYFLGLLLAHPLLSDEELAAFLNLHLKSVRCSLYALHRLGCLEPTSTEVGKRWHLCQRGLRLLAAANHLHLRTIGVTSDGAAGGETATVSLRGEGWLLQHMQHTAGIYGFFAALVQAARREPGHTLCWWEAGAACERGYRVGEQWYNLRPDALAEYRVGAQQFRFWLEWDRGTMNVRDLAVKFASYAHYIASREWAREMSRLPRLFCIAPDIAQERRLHRVAQAGLAHTPGVALWSTTKVLLHEYGPLAPVWLRSMPPRVQGAQASDTRRQRLYEIS